MKASVLEALGSPVVVRDVPDPVLGTGEVVVDIVACGVLAYAGDVYSGKRQYLLKPPVVPGTGGIGRIAAVGRDAAKLKVGDWVYCDPTVRARDDAISPEIVLQGLTAGSLAALPLHEYFHDGSFAERLRTPTENVMPIGDLTVEEAPRWMAMGKMLVPYGGWLASELKAGETALVSGATGAFGSAAVAVALAMGVRCVVASGRNRKALDELSRRFGARVRPVQMSGDEATDHAALLAAAPGPIDCVLDILPPAATPSQVRAAITTVRPYGRIVLMGGIQEDVAVSYAWLMRNCITLRGKWMYPREAPSQIAGMIRAGLIDLKHLEVTSFALEQINQAIEHAAAHAGPFAMTVIQP